MEDVTEKLERLLTGLASEDMRAGNSFFYDESPLYDDEVGHLALPCVLCIAQDLSERLGQGTLGYEFDLGATDRPGFPLAFVRGRGAEVGFLEAAPFVTEIFERDVKACRADLGQLFERAAQILRPEFDLGTSQMAFRSLTEPRATHPAHAGLH